MNTNPNPPESPVHPFIGWTDPVSPWDWPAVWQALLLTRLGKLILQRTPLQAFVKGWLA
jgi:hypothetical protein